MNINKQFIAVKGLVVHANKILLLKESSKWHLSTHADEYGLVGGRLEIGEKFEEALKREIFEESGLVVSIENPIHVDEWRPTIKDEVWQIVGIFFVCKTNSNTVVLSGEHDDYLWIDPKEYDKYNLIPASKNAIEKYLNFQTK